MRKLLTIILLNCAIIVTISACAQPRYDEDPEAYIKDRCGPTSTYKVVQPSNRQEYEDRLEQAEKCDDFIEGRYPDTEPPAGG